MQINNVNKKRGGEATKITLQQYASHANRHKENADNFLESLRYRKIFNKQTKTFTNYWKT